MLPIGILPAGFPASGGLTGNERSVRLRASALAHLSWTPGNAGNRKLLTKRVCCRRSRTGTLEVIASAGTASIDRFYFDSSDRLCLDVLGTARLVTTQVFRDPSEFYILGFTLDVANGTAVSRATILVNDVEVSSYSTDGRASISNTDTNWNDVVVQYYGRDNAGNYFDGYLTQIASVDGSNSITYSETDANNIVIPKGTPTATWGAKGHLLTFRDATSTTTLAYDSSGNGNHFTASGISLTSGVTDDSMLDYPVNGTAANGIGCYATLNPLDSALSLKDGNLAWTAPSNTEKGSRATFGLTSGTMYFEYKLPAGSGTPFSMVGIATQAQSNTAAMPTGAGAKTYAYYPYDQKKYNNGSGTAYGTVASAGQWIKVAVNVTSLKIWWGIAGGAWFGSGDPAAGTNAAFTLSSLAAGEAYFPWIQEYNQTSAINFGQQPFVDTPPTGFKALCTTNLPTPAIPQPKKHMDVKTHLGTSGAQNITGLLFAPDIAWVKGRNNANPHYLADSVRGANRFIGTDNQLAENASLTNELTAFNSDGISLGASSNGYTNGSGNSYVDWFWRAGGAAVTNNAGSISSQVSVNTAAGISVGTFIIPSAFANSTVGHGLNAPLAFLMFRPLNVSSALDVWHKSLGATQYLQLDTPAAVATNSNLFNGQSSTTFTLGSSSWFGGVSYPALFYCFAEIDGFSKFGSFPGNGSANGPFVYCGFLPRWLLMKRVDSSGDWLLVDTARNTYNVVNFQLLPNSSSAEYSAYGLVDVVSNGFKWRYADPGWNTNGSTWIYAAFAEYPFALNPRAR